MKDVIRELVLRHQAPEALAEEIVSLLQSTAITQRLTAFVDSYDPVALDRTLDAPVAVDADFGPPSLDATERYEDLGLIGEGGAGEVRRVRDLELNRVVAMKIVHAAQLGRERALARFIEEAQATAQLQHPNIVPVHDAGILPDGRAWFTMREVRGRSMADVIDDVHAGRSTWSFRRLVESLHQVCRAVAYAHERGVIHRDLKPHNVVLGDHGEVYLLDWGLAKVLGRRDWAAELGDLPTGDLSAENLRKLLADSGSLVVTDRAVSGSHKTRVGTVTGTPVYMAPEQARGEIDQIDERSDVFGLGAILYELLSGQVPYQARDLVEVVAMAAVGARTPLKAGALPIPVPLAIACERALAPDPIDRFQTAGELADALLDWLDGAKRREQALEFVDRALTGATEASTLRDRARALRSQGAAFLHKLEPWRPEGDKVPGWAREDDAARLEKEADLAEVTVDQGLQAALRVDPELPEAHAVLAERYLRRHKLAEKARDFAAAARLEPRIQLHAAALPRDHGTRTTCTTYLKGDGALTLVTDPPGVEAKLYRYALENRRLVEQPLGSLGTTPLHEVRLEMGSYLVVLSHPGRAEVRYPVEIPRLGHWDGIAPGKIGPTPIWLPPEGALPQDAIYVPAGWFHVGGDPEAVVQTPARRLWCDALVVQRFLVTNRVYLAFLDDLVALGRTDEALRFAPRERSGAGEQGALIYAFDGEKFSLQPDGDGDVWDLDWPVVMVDSHGARACLTWQAARTGVPWRLPGELEWEKAARGVDGRSYPWGDGFDPSWTCMVDSHRGRRLPAVEGAYPIDVSPYGVRGLAGNVADWCLDPYEGGGRVVDRRVLEPDPSFAANPDALLVSRGGSWLLTSRASRCANRLRYEAWTRNPGLGFRGAYRPRTADD